MTSRVDETLESVVAAAPSSMTEKTKTISTNETAESMKTNTPSHQLGDRVALTGFPESSRLNGQHGCIALEGGKLRLPNDRYSIHLDRLNPVGIHVATNNIRRLPPNPENDATSNGLICATVMDGVLADHGALLMNTMNLMKWYIANQYFHDSNANQLDDIPKLPPSQRIKYNKFMIDHWNNTNNAEVYDDGSRTQQSSSSLKSTNKNDDTNTNNATATPNVYIDLFQFIYKNQAMHPLQRSFLIQSFSTIRALKSWNASFQQDLWFVGRDYYGTYVVPDCNLRSVYRIVGLVKPQMQMMYKQSPTDKPSLQKIPIKVPDVTVFPWYGRLIYDTTSTGLSQSPSDNPNQTKPTVVPVKASTEMAMQLHAVVLKAIQEQRVIDHFTELDEHAINHQNATTNTVNNGVVSSADPKKQTRRDDDGSGGTNKNDSHFHSALN